jgi:hypothetical protein
LPQELLVAMSGKEVDLVPSAPGGRRHRPQDIDAAVDAGEITLVDTGEVYRCSVVQSGIALR